LEGPKERERSGIDEAAEEREEEEGEKKKEKGNDTGRERKL
jgi:hypothetical protein